MFSPSGMILLKKPINHLFWLCAHVHPPNGNFCTWTVVTAIIIKNISSLQTETLKHDHAGEHLLSLTEIDKLEIYYYLKPTGYMHEQAAGYSDF